MSPLEPVPSVDFPTSPPSSHQVRGQGRNPNEGTSKPGQGGVTLPYVCPHCHRFPLEDYIWWISSGHGKKQCNWWCEAGGGLYDWKVPNKVLVIQDSTDCREAKVCRAHASPQGVCDDLINALKLLANKHKVGVSPIKMVVLGTQERSRLKIMDGLRQFIVVDSHEAVKVGDEM